MFVVVNNEETLKVEPNSTAAELAKHLNLTNPSEALAVSINDDLKDLNTTLKDNDRVVFWDFNDPEGQKIFWHTSAHVLAKAVLRLWPEAIPTIGPAIEKGFYYDFANLNITEADLEKIEAEVEKILDENPHIERVVFKNKKEALEFFSKNKYKVELIQELKEDEPITAYKLGDFLDLCRGPHLPTVRKIKGFKILKNSGAYWRGNPENEMLTRIYAISFPDRKTLKDYLFTLEEAKKRDHKVLGAQLDLFSIKEESPGCVFLHPNGMIIWNRLSEFWKEIHTYAGYHEIKTPQLLTRELWEKSGHWQNYKENMYTVNIEKRDFALKPMSCPGCLLLYKSRKHSYRELPIRYSEIGHVHRHEPSGALNGLFRVRSFHQDDAHIFTLHSDLKKEILGVLHLTEILYGTFGLHHHLELSTRPKNSIGSDENWAMSTGGLLEALDEYNKPYKINEGDGAFYGPKIDIHIKDALDRSWQCGTIQVDMSMPERFDITYTSAQGTEERPIMIHRAIFGSLERFFGILIEHFAGKFPLWLSPTQIRILPVAERHAEYAKYLMRELHIAKFNCDVDDSNESFNKKVRNAQLANINYMLAVGDKELENKSVNIRTRDNVVHGEMPYLEFLEEIKVERDTKSLTSRFAKKE